MPKVLDTEVTLDNVGSVLAWCAQNQGDDFAPASGSWGFTVAAHFLNEVKDSPLYAAAQEAFGRFLREGAEHEVRFAVSLAHPAMVPPDTWTEALQRQDLDAETIDDLRVALGMAARKNRRAYATWMRGVVGKPRWYWYLAAFAAWDHVWLLDNLPVLLEAATDTTRAPGSEFSFTLDTLNRAEALRFRDELAARRGQYGDALLDPALELLDGDLARGAFPDGDGTIRWLDA